MSTQLLNYLSTYLRMSKEQLFTANRFLFLPKAMVPFLVFDRLRYCGTSGFEFIFKVFGFCLCPMAMFWYPAVRSVNILRTLREVDVSNS